MSFAEDLEQELGNKATAACEYYAAVHDKVKEVVEAIANDAHKSRTFGREFMLLECSEKKADAGIAFRRLDVKSNYVSAYIAANAGEPGEFRASVCYDASGRKPKSLTWYFPKADAVSPEEMADKFVRAIVLPGDETFA